MKTKITLKQLFYIFLIICSTSKAMSQCFEIQSILVAACVTAPNTEGFNEMVRFKVGAAPINTGALTVNWPAQAWQGLVQNAATAAKVASINASITLAGGCGQLIEPTGGILPANAEVILITSENFTINANVFGAITQNIYIIFQSNPTVVAGHFGNYSATPGLRTLTMSFGACSDSVTYDRTLLAPNPGATANFTPGGTASYTNPGCVAPVDVFTVDAGTTPVTACPGDTISLSGTAVGYTTINGWTAAVGSFSVPNALATNFTLPANASGSIVLTLSVTNSCGVTISDTVTVNVNATVTPTFNAVSAICSGSALSALPTTSTNSITGSWSPALNNAATTTYTFTPNAGQCAVSATLTITVNSQVTPAFNAVAAICAGSALSPLPTNSTNGISGSWSPALDNTTTTTYTFTPTAGQCATNATLTVTVNPANTAPAFNAIPDICPGETVAALPTTSTNGITGSWSPAVNNTATTTYTFTPNAGQCAVSTTLTITLKPVSVIPTFTQYPSYCAGAVIPALPVVSNNGVTGNWSPAINNTTTTVYTFTPDPGQCSNTKQLSINILPIVTPTFSLPASICSGESLVFPTTSTNGITGSWLPALNNTATTTYTFTPNNAGQCANSTTVTIGVNALVATTFNPIAAICSGSTLAALPTTSTNGISGTWSPAPNNTATTVYTFTPNAGQCGTTATLTVTVNSLTVPAFNTIPAVCSGSVLAPLPTTSTNGINGTWSPALNNTATTTYTFTPNASQCATTQTLTITVNPLILPAFAAVASRCSGMSALVLPTTSTNGIAGVWSPAFNTTTTTTYTFTPNTGQCASNTTLTVTINPILTPAFNAPAPVCSGSTLSPLPVNSVNGITGTWSPALNNTATTTYTFTPAAGECAVSTTLTIVVNPIVVPSFPAVAAICAGNALSALPTTSTNGILGSWSPGLNNTTTTTYTFTPTPGIGQCAATTTLTITVTPRTVPVFTAVAPICSGSTLAPLPTTSLNGITGTWTPPLDNASTRTYTFTPTAGLCATTATLVITVNPNATPYFVTVAPICAGAPLSPLPTTSTNGITGTWSPAINNMVTTNYIFTPAAGQCARANNMVIIVNQNVLPTFNPVAPICAGEPLAPLPTRSTNGITGTWSPTLSNLVSDVYTFTPDAGQCATTALFTTDINPLVIPLFDAAPIPVFACAGTPLAALPTTSANGITGNWSPPINNTATTTYMFTPDPGQCADINRLTINIITPVTKNETYFLCVDSNGNGINSVTINSNLSPAVYDFAWTIDGAPVSNTTELLVATEPGTYILEATNKITGCIAYTLIAEVKAVIPAKAFVTASNDFADAQQITVTVVGGLGSYEYQLNGGTFQTSNVFDVYEGGDYVISVKDNLGCNNFELQITLLNYPKFFTPNADGYNDTWNIEGLKAGNKAEIFIFDRYGKLLKQISPFGLGWDGTYNGREVPATDYWFKILYTDKNGSAKEFNSHFALKR